jgi:predicted NUDIX family NTP pyrophosphohydrolase
LNAAGILAYRQVNKNIEFFLVHPGGPFFKNKDLGSWTIPKGEFTDEAPLDAAIREFKEETGIDINGNFIELGKVKQKGGKTVQAWAVEFDFDAAAVRSNTFKLEWPPRSGKMQEYPEIDRGEWFGLHSAIQKINPAQIFFLNNLIGLIHGS